MPNQLNVIFIIDFLDANSDLPRLQWRFYCMWKMMSWTWSSPGRAKEDRTVSCVQKGIVLWWEGRSWISQGWVLGEKNSPESAHSANDRRNLIRFAGEKVRGVEENENIVLEKWDEFEAEARHCWNLKPLLGTNNHNLCCICHDAQREPVESLTWFDKSVTGEGSKTPENWNAARI